MPDRRVAVFFYGSYINPDVLKEVGVFPERVQVARVPGFDIRIAPLANLVPSEQHVVFGILAGATHGELARLYSHARDVLGGTYLPEAVLTQTLDGRLTPALCYIAPAMQPLPARNDYIDLIVSGATQYGFPSWYLAKLESFRP